MEEQLRCKNCNEELEADTIKCPECGLSRIDSILKFSSEAFRELAFIVKQAITDENLREEIIANPNCPDEIRAKLDWKCEDCIHSREKSSNPNKGRLICTNKDDAKVYGKRGGCSFFKNRGA